MAVESLFHDASETSSFQLVFEAKMAKGQAKTDRLQVTIAVRTHAYLQLLADKGTHGVSVPDVAKGLIERGIQIAIQEGVLTSDEVRGVQLEK